MSDVGPPRERPPVAGGDERERRRRNLAILLVVLGLFGMGAAALGLALLEARRGTSRQYRGIEELHAPPESPPAEPR